MFARKTMPERLRESYAIFLAQAERVEAARRALLGCLPVGRVDPAPVPVGLDLLRDELSAVAAGLEDWRVPEVEATWRRVAEAVEESAGAIAHADHVARTTRQLEELLDAVGEVIEPLDAWGTAEQAWLRLRERARR